VVQGDLLNQENQVLYGLILNFSDAQVGELYELPNGGLSLWTQENESLFWLHLQLLAHPIGYLLVLGNLILIRLRGEIPILVLELLYVILLHNHLLLINLR
jgi:hypothetical protein